MPHPTRTERTATFRETYASINDLYHSYFGFAPENRRLTFLFILLMFCNLLFIACIAAIDIAFTSLMGILELPHITYSLFFKGVLQFSGAVALYSANRMITSKVARWISDSLCTQKNQAFKERFTKVLPYYGYTEKELNISQSFFPGQRRTLYHIFWTFNSFLITHIEGLLSLYKLWMLSTTAFFVIFSIPIVIPYYILLAVLIYALGYNALFNYMSQGYQEAKDNKTEAVNKIEKRTLHMLEFTKEIGLTNTENQERKDIEALEEDEKNHASKYYYLEETLSFMRDVYSEISMAMGVILSAPMIIAKQITSIKLLIIGGYFSRITNMFSWSRDKFEDIATVKTGIKNLLDFQHSIEKLEALAKKPKANIYYNPSDKDTVPVLHIKDLSWYGFAPTLSKKEPQNIHNHIHDISVHAGEVVNIQGRNGCGKSILFLVLKGLWPLGSKGAIYFKCKKSEAVFIPQKPYSPYESTIDDILRAAECSKDMVKIKEAFTQAGLCYHTHAKSKANTLSGGEQQRLKLAILFLTYPPSSQKSPSAILLDEALSAIDKEGRPSLLTLLKEKYPKAAFLCINHENETDEASSPKESQTMSFYTHCLSFHNAPQESATDPSIMEREVKFSLT
jgi:ABC-type uncharacterized transport system fused permease/ATPase subunit